MDPDVPGKRRKPRLKRDPQKLRSTLTERAKADKRLACVITQLDLLCDATDPVAFERRLKQFAKRAKPSNPILWDTLQLLIELGTAGDSPCQQVFRSLVQLIEEKALFELLTVALYPRMERAASRFEDPRSPLQSREDLRQEAWIVLFIRLRRLKQPDIVDPVSYYFGCAERRLSEVARAEKMHRTTKTHPLQDSDLSCEAYHVDVAHRAHQRLLLDTFKRYKATDLDLEMLSHLEQGRGEAEIARERKCSRQSVHAALERLRRRLMEFLQDQ